MIQCAHPTPRRRRKPAPKACNLRFVGQAEDEIRIDAEDALGAIDGLEVRRMFSGWGFYQRGLLFAAASAKGWLDGLAVACG